MNTAQKIIKNTFSLLFSGIITQLFSFILIIYLARILGPGDFGKINFSIAIVTYFTLIANLGLPLLGTREIARDKGKINEYLGNILTLRLFLSVLSFGLLLLVTFFLNKSLEIKHLIILYGLGVIFSALVIDWVFQGVEKMEYIGLGRILAGLVSTGLVLVFIKTQRQLLLIPCFQVAGSILMAGIFILIFVKNFGKLRLNFNFILWENLFRQALPLGISIIMVQIIYNIDTIMLGFMRSDAEIGYYNAAYKIITPLIMVGAVYFDAIFPLISNYYKISLESLKILQSYTAKLIVTIVIPLAIGGFILARPIVNLLYGSEYNNAIIAFQFLIWVVALVCLNSIYARGLWACNRQNEFMKIVILQAMANIGFNFFLIPRFGIVGAAISTVAAELLGFFFYYREFNKIIPVPIYNYIPRPLLAAIVMAIFLKLGASLNMWFLILILGGITTYLASLYFMKGIIKEDIKLIQGIFLRDSK